ncbi:MAG: S49 family peptidase [Calditrichota bacterium]
MIPAYRIFSIVLLALFIAHGAMAQGNRSDLPNYGDGSQALTATPGTQGGAAAGFWNPAAWAAMREFEASFLWNDNNITSQRMDNWALFTGGHGIGFAMRHNIYRYEDTQAYHVNDYQLALSGGDRDDYWGVAYNWSKGDTRGLKRDSYFTLSNIYRPYRFLSIGNAASLALHGDYRGISDVGLRPFSNHRITLFGDAAYGRYDNFKSLQWGAGLEVQPFDGIRLAAKMTKPLGQYQDKIYSISMGISVDGTGFHVIPHYDKDSDRISTSYLIRVGSQEPTFNPRRLINPDPQLVTVSMKGQLGYRKARWFDRDRMALLDMIELIENAKNDPAIEGIAFNLSGMSAPRELLWEVREKLKEFKAEGKIVYMYADRLGMESYYFATVADYLWMDPSGGLMLPGYVAGRTFWKGFFEKIGLGAEEWRYFTYKSAFESFSRKEMSEADREQRLALITDFYDEWQTTVSESRNVSPDMLRSSLDSTVIFLPEEALAAGLIDSIANWDDVKELVEGITGEEPELISAKDVDAEEYADPYWGEPPKIAIVYAIGECDMDSGIRGRYTSRVLRKLAKRSDVKAVVLRADSPGGDALPSDLVSRQMTTVSNKKPMIVSQGSLAASGGYWISMNGDRIFASPYTLTGSIGVIGGWVWNNGFSDKTGFSFDHVQIGDHADLSRGVTLPLIGVTIPDRNLSMPEKQRVEKLLKAYYKDFTGKVAMGRDLEESYVDSIGQGRVWSGTRALELGLVDEIGGLDRAVTYARIEAKLPAKGRTVEIIEFPRRSWVNPGDLMSSPSPISEFARWLGLKEAPANLADDYELSFYKRISANPGVPLYMVAPADIPAEDK